MVIWQPGSLHNAMGTARRFILSLVTSGGDVAHTWAQLTEGMQDYTENSLHGVGSPEVLTVKPLLPAFYPKEYDSPQCIEGNCTLVKLTLLQWHCPPHLPLVSSPNTCCHPSSPWRYLGGQVMLSSLIVASWSGCPENPSNL
jgi:hypothetical protein